MRYMITEAVMQAHKRVRTVCRLAESKSCLSAHVGGDKREINGKTVNQIKGFLVSDDRRTLSW